MKKRIHTGKVLVPSFDDKARVYTGNGWEGSPWQATLSSGGELSLLLLRESPRPSAWSRILASRGFRFAVFLALIAGFTALLTLSSKALFSVILALGVAGVVSASWKFSA